MYLARHSRDPSCDDGCARPVFIYSALTTFHGAVQEDDTPPTNQPTLPMIMSHLIDQRPLWFHNFQCRWTPVHSGKI